VGAHHQRPPLPGGPYAIVGLARSGQAAARLLASLGEEVIGVDSAAPAGVAGLQASGVEVWVNVDGVQAIERARCVVKSPGVPGSVAAIRAARERGIPVIGELELAWRLLPNEFVAVTGTNGKTTVTELLGHVWRTAGRPVAVGGNVGTPLASLVGDVELDATVVCEASSFQLEDTTEFAPEAGVLLNISPDHLDRHSDLDEYVGAKLRVFANQDEDDVAVFNGADPALAGRELGGRARRLDFAPRIGDFEFALPGPHNAANAAAAAVTAEAAGIDRAAIGEALRTFPGVAHRLERVAEVGGVLYVNDSKATNAAAASAALRSFDRPVRVILGGSLKGGGFSELAAPLGERAVAAHLIGEAAAALEHDLEPAWAAGVAHMRHAGLAEAVAAAAAAAQPGDVVLLAPACASFDAYEDFEARGEHFRDLVEGLR
jgi:UDP-N-acetylmuramoylalanine--D-glutamate ligase